MKGVEEKGRPAPAQQIRKQPVRDRSSTLTKSSDRTAAPQLPRDRTATPQQSRDQPVIQERRNRSSALIDRNRKTATGFKKNIFVSLLVQF